MQHSIPHSPAGASAPEDASSPGRHVPVGLVLFALATGAFAIGTTEFAAMSLLPFFARGLAIDEPTAGHVISAYALGVVVGAPVIAVLSARLSRRSLLLGLMALFGVANGLTALAPSYHWMVFFRFLSGLPHGAYFGIAALVAASLVPPGKRAQSVSYVMTGLTVATVIGVPAANALGQWIGWRWGFGIVALLALTAVALVWLYAPRDRPDPNASPLRELGALGRRQVWLTLGIGAIGFGGMFAVYTYLASTLMQVTGAAPAMVPAVLVIFGIGMTVGNLGAAWAADRWQMKSVAVMLIWSALMLALYPFATGHLWSMLLIVLAIGLGGGLGSPLQTRLMDVAGDAQALAAALNHSAFNTANALGPWLAGLAVAGGYGLPSTGYVGSALALGGLAIWGLAMIDQRGRRAEENLACA
ncbi:MFS transporter [Sphingobium sp. H39-3-25]|uniref:MFS transporter n=1 Tax=Sphingobium arseniciresistens TaxID=3030834 RepID=UPI0023B9877C|nr:MFS transporter [Sphingobium arseniciresistens]